MASSEQQPLKRRRLLEQPPEPPAALTPQSPAHQDTEAPAPTPKVPPDAAPAPPQPQLQPPSEEEETLKRRSREEIRSVYESYKKIRFCISQKEARLVPELEQAYRYLITASRGCPSVHRIVADLIPRYVSHCPTALEDAAQVMVDMHNWNLAIIKRGEDIDGVAFQTTKACILGLVDICCTASLEEPTSSVIQGKCSPVFLNVLTFFVTSFGGRDIFQIVDRNSIKLPDSDTVFSDLKLKLSEESEPSLIKLSKFRAISILRILFACPKQVLAACFELLKSTTAEGIQNDGHYFLNQVISRRDADDMVCLMNSKSDEAESSVDSVTKCTERNEVVHEREQSVLNQVPDSVSLDPTGRLLELVISRDKSLKNWIIRMYNQLKKISSKSLSEVLPALKECLDSIGVVIVDDTPLESDEKEVGPSRLRGISNQPVMAAESAREGSQNNYRAPQFPSQYPSHVSLVQPEIDSQSEIAPDQCSNNGVPVGGAELEEVDGFSGLVDYNQTGSDCEDFDPNNSDSEAESDTAMEARSTYQGLDDWEEELECNDWAVHARSSFSVSDDFRVGDCFEDKKKLQRHVKEWHIKNARQFKTYKSSKSLIILKCMNDSCYWSLRATQCQFMGDWTITKLGPAHLCQHSSPIKQHRHIDCKFIFDLIYPHVRSNSGIRICDLQQVVKDTYAHEPTYRKVWYAKCNVIEDLYGSHESAFEKFPHLMLAQSHYNPGTVFDYEWKRTDGQDRATFDKWFWAYAPSIEGFPHCLPLISIDSTQLYSRYTGKLLAAVAYDANNAIFPLAFTLCDNESSETWKWFLERLRRHVTKDARQVCIISDCEPGIKNAIEEVFPEPHGVHRYCARHLANNFYTHSQCKKLKKKFEEMVLTPNKQNFLRMLQEFKSSKDGKYKSFIEGCGHVSKWSLSHDGGLRYGVMTTNRSEIFNKVFKNARSLPVIALLKETFLRMNTYWVNCTARGRSESSEGHTFLGKIRDLLKEAEVASNHFTATTHIYDVKFSIGTPEGESYAVDLNERECECGEWTLYGYPCKHAVCAIQKVNASVDSFVDPQFWIGNYIRAYAHPFRPLLQEHNWPQWEGPTITVDPDMLISGKEGKKVRFHNEGKKKKCSQCGQEGHNKRSCKNNS